MIRTTALEARQRRERLDAKTLDNLFRRRIEEGANCSPFVSAAILQIAKDAKVSNQGTSKAALGVGVVAVSPGADTPPGTNCSSAP
jgi:hypothetical protein